jgi:hypothetical protein
MKRCPACQSTNVRRSGCCSEEKLTHALQSPYRCNDCNARFWLLSRTTRIGAAVAGAFVSVAMLFLAGVALLHEPADAASVAADAPLPGVFAPAGSPPTHESASSVPMAGTFVSPR